MWYQATLLIAQSALLFLAFQKVSEIHDENNYSISSNFSLSSGTKFSKSYGTSELLMPAKRNINNPSNYFEEEKSAFSIHLQEELIRSKFFCSFVLKNNTILKHELAMWRWLFYETALFCLVVIGFACSQLHLAQLQRKDYVIDILRTVQWIQKSILELNNLHENGREHTEIVQAIHEVHHELRDAFSDTNESLASIERLIINNVETKAAISAAIQV